MQVISTSIPDVLIIEPKVFGDARGFFMESFNARAFDEAVGRHVEFVQDNHSRSTKGVLRGLHYQMQQPQGTFGQWVGVELTEDNHRQLWVPAGFAHGFLVLSDSADFLYKTTDYYAPAHERCIVWNDASLGIEWPALDVVPQLSQKDMAGHSFDLAEVFP